MKVLESAPSRYDRGIRMLSRGRIEMMYERIAETAAAPGRRVLDVGCGTGAVALACARHGARVVGMDRSAEMLAVARGKSVEYDAGGSVEWVELAAAEIEDRFGPAEFDAVVSCLAFSEMSPEERAYVLRTAYRCLLPGGRVLIADETLPTGRVARIVRALPRGLLKAITYLLTQQTTHPILSPEDLFAGTEFTHVKVERFWGDSFFLARGEKPSGGEKEPGGDP